MRQKIDANKDTTVNNDVTRDLCVHLMHIQRTIHPRKRCKIKFQVLFSKSYLSYRNKNN